MISNVDDIGHLTSDEKRKTKSAIVLLRNLFSQDLGSLIDERHPIVENLSMSIPWTRRWLISLAEAIQILSNQTNGSKIKSMLRNKSKYRETLLYLCIGKCLVDSNFSLEFIEEKNNPTPDWKITDLRTNEQFVLELTEISRPTPRQEDILKTQDRVSQKLFTLFKSSDPRLFYMTGILKNFISMPALEELYKRIDLAAESAKKSGFEEIDENDTLILAFATEPNYHKLVSWAIQRGIVDSKRVIQNTCTIVGPTFEIEGSYRIKKRIKEKKDQHQFDKKNLNNLVIKYDDFFRSAPSSKYFSMVEEFVYQHDYLAMLIIVGGYVRQKMVNELTIEKILEKDNHLYLLQGFNQFVREILIIMNKYSKDNQRTLALSSRIQTAFKTCKTLVS
jgi:hypothetical protein